MASTSVIEELHPVLAEIRSRQAGKRTIGHRLALSVEGGGVRGVISAAMLQELQKLHITAALFDEIYGTSAGAINATAYLAGAPEKILDQYRTNSNDSLIIRKRNLISRKPVINVPLLITRVLGRLKPAEITAILQAQRLRILATRLDDGQTVAFTAPASKRELADYLIASCSIPILVPAKIITGQRYVDALITESIPLETPLQNNCTHLLILSTRPLGTTAPNRRLNNFVVTRKFRKQNSALRIKTTRRQRLALQRATYLQQQSTQPTKSPYVLAIAPGGTRDALTPLNHNQRVINKAIQLGTEAVLDVFERGS